MTDNLKKTYSNFIAEAVPDSDENGVFYRLKVTTIGGKVHENLYNSNSPQTCVTWGVLRSQLLMTHAETRELLDLLEAQGMNKDVLDSYYHSTGLAKYERDQAAQAELDRFFEDQKRQNKKGNEEN